MDMVEKVARGVYASRNGAGATNWSRLTKVHKAPYLSDAKAAIEAMMGPTPKMLKRCGCMEGFAPEYAEEADRCHVDWFKAMIKSALEEGE